ncbi:DKNYY domain-containing protein [Candidatus Woesebacteria bacterium]|nr:DKNYY domain-containing protein [Candidatus Woesebacteria bacterium]
MYYFGIEIENADPISFVAKYLGYAHDKNAVYYLGILMPCADPSTLTVTQYVVKDKNYMYLN